MDLSNLRPAEDATHSDDFRRGRDHGSSNGRAAGKGHKGQETRSGAPRPGFEGGQVPLYKRLPKRGFKNRNTRDVVAVNVERLEKLENGSEVTAESLTALDIISHTCDGVKILDNDKLTKKLAVRINTISEGTGAKIEAMGGTCEVL